MQGGVGEEDALQHTRAEFSVEVDAGLDVVFEAGAALDDDDGAVALAGEVRDGGGDLIEGEVVLGVDQPSPEAGAASALERAPDLRLEDDNDADDETGQGVAHEEVDHREVEHASEQEDGYEGDHAAADKRHGGGSAEGHEQGVDKDGDDQDVEGGGSIEAMQRIPDVFDELAHVTSLRGWSRRTSTPRGGLSARGGGFLPGRRLRTARLR